ncbi:ABC transporter substrate-binding protein [Poseidonocella sp. HB161398]|uniref:ABC transporter substrate-binding protein n=1 Tax=Poseidonocella sp. HB161398 TaxID=2320855 RepID=UPI001F1143EF|nr:substrate-binding domain-containing protein [Poseidonocella sp. HB161398]
MALGLAAGLAGLAAPTRTRAAPPLILWSATDTDVFARILEAFADVHPGIAVDYHEIGTLPLHRRIGAGMEPPPNLAISPALDLQVELVNLGLARALPGRAPAVAPGTSWRSELFCFTREPEVVLLNRAAFAGLPQPRSHAALAALMRNRGDLLAGRLATYDIRRSGIGHLLSSQKAGLGPDQARLTEIMGRTGTRLFATSAEMFRATATGEVLIATGVLGSYADALARHDPRTEILLFEDYNLAVPRSGLVHRGARQPEAAGLLLRFLLSVGGQAALADAGLMPLSGPPGLTGAERATLMLLHPGPQMLLWQDRRKRERHLAAWADSIRAD